MDVKAIEKAAKRLRDVVHTIPADVSGTFSRMSDSELYLKCENLQKTGSFKVRGAYNKIASLVEQGEKPTAVIASSAGNHAQGVAYAASSIGVPATIVMPKGAPLAKVSATESYGAQVVLHGAYYDDAYQKAVEIQQETGGVFIHPFDDEEIIAGQGTIGLELLKDVPALDTVIVPAGGGGLLAGIAACLKQLNPRIQVIGVQAEGADAICRSFQEKSQVTLETVHTIADGIAVKAPGEITTKLVCNYVDEMVRVSDNEIASAILLLLERAKQVVEPAGAASVAAAISGRLNLSGKKVACILSGGNIDVSFIHKVVEKGLITRGRQVNFYTRLPDTPGSLERFSRVTGQCGANILMVRHDRLLASLGLDEAILHATCEVSGPEHVNQLFAALRESGFHPTISQVST